MARRYAQLDLDDRRRLYRLKVAKTPVAEVARLMGRHRSTIHRELARNTHHDAEVPQASGGFGWWRTRAQGGDARHVGSWFADRSCAAPSLSASRRAGSRKQIGSRLRLKGDRENRLRQKAIHQLADSKDEHALGLVRLLSEGRRRRRPRGGRRAPDAQGVDKMSIELRPEAVLPRQEFGHWEGGLLMFRKVVGVRGCR